MSNTAVVSYKWSEKGKQPLITQKQSRRERRTLFGSVNPITGEVIAQQAEKGNAKSFKKYLKKVLDYYKSEQGKIHMILDNVRYHHAKLLKPFLEKNKDRLDKMSQEYYDTPLFGWLILQANPTTCGVEFDIPNNFVMRIPFPLIPSLQDYRKNIELYKLYYGE